MPHTRIKFFLLFSALVLAIGSLLWFAASRVQSASKYRDYPPFEMVYKTWRLYNGQERAPQYNVVRLKYVDHLHWRLETLEETSVPDYVGSFTEVSGNIIRSENKRFKTTGQKTVDLSEGVYAPDEWLIPIRVSEYKAMAGATIRPTEIPGLLEITFTEQVPCDPETWNCVSDTYEVVTAVRYWTGSELPMGMTVTSNGELVREITVTDFKWLSSK